MIGVQTCTYVYFIILTCKFLFNAFYYWSCVNSPFCLGMTDCHWANQLRMTPCYHQSDLRIPSASKKCRRPPKVASLQMLQEALDGHFVPLEITHPDRHDPGCTIQIRASSDVMLLGNVLWFFIGMQLLAANRNCKLTHDQ